MLGEDGRVHLFALNALFLPPPAGDRNALRLTSDMLHLLGALGGDGVAPLSSEPFKYFCSLMVRGYLAVRQVTNPKKSSV